MRRPKDKLILDTNAASHTFGVDRRYTIWIDGCIEERNSDYIPQIGIIPKWVAEEIIRLARLVNPTKIDELDYSKSHFSGLDD